MNPVVSNINESDAPFLKFRISEIDASLANAIRRIMLSEIPVIVFRTAPHNKNRATYEINTSRMNNELIGQRLSCIPIYISDLDFPIENYQMEVDKKNNSDQIDYVTTRDFKIKDLNSGKYLGDSELNSIFPPNPLTGDYIDLMRLRPRISDEIEGEHLKLKCKFDIGTAKEDGAFNVVATCAYSATQDPIKARDAWAIKAAEMKKAGALKEAIDFAEKDWNLLDAKRYFVANSYDFLVESVGPMTNMDIVYKACIVMIKKLLDFKALMQTQEDLIKVSESTIENSIDITIPKEGYTLGKVIEYILNTKHFNKTLTYCGFRKPHPHIDLCIIRLAFKEPITDMGKIVIYLIDAADDAVAIYKKISESFAQKK
jgi:DNA-directed RNA polymerase subunit L